MKFLYRLQRDRIILDGRGREKKRTSSTYEVIPLADGVYRKLIGKDGQPLSEKEAQKQQRKAEARLRRQRDLSPSGRARLERKHSERRRKEALFWEEAVRAFHFHYRGEEVLNGRPVAVVDLLPHEKYRPAEKDFWILDKIKGRIWIDRQDLQLSQVEMEFIKPVKVAGGLVAKLYKGSTLWIRQEKVRDEVWFPRRFEATMNGRIFSAQGFQHADDRRVFRLSAFRNQRAAAPGRSSGCRRDSRQFRLSLRPEWADGAFLGRHRPCIRPPPAATPAGGSSS